MDFLYVNVLYFMFLPALILLYLIVKKQDKINQYFSDEIIDKLSLRNKYISKKARNVMLVISLIFMIVALSRPVTNEQTHSSSQDLHSTVIALDVSKSMLANDIYPSRLEFGRKKVFDILENVSDSAVGVVLFSTSSYILSPLTNDVESLKKLVQRIDTKNVFDGGSNIQTAIQSASNLLKNKGDKNLIIITDGGDKKDFKDEINLAKNNNINIYTLAVATENKTPIKLKNGNFLTDKSGEIVTVSLNENIKNLSLKTDGGFINFTTNSSDVKQILEDIKASSKKDVYSSKKFKTYTEIFYYPLALGILVLFMALFSFPDLKKSTKTLTLITALTLFSNLNLNASILDFKHIMDAEEHYKNKEYKKAYDEFEKIDKSEQKKYNLGNSLYKQGKYAQAIHKYNEIKSDDRDFNFKKFHNLGNAYAKNKEYKKAITSYEKALKIKDEKKTKENLEAVKKLLDKNKKKNNSKNKNSNSRKNKENKSNKDKKDEKKNKRNEEKKKEIDKPKQKDKIISKKEEEKWLKKIENSKNKKVFLKKDVQIDNNTKW